MAREETNRISGKVDKSYVEVPAFKYNQETRVAAAKALNQRTGSFKGWADDAKNELNAQLKKQVEEALNICALQGFPGFAASRPLREWYQQQQELLACCPPRRRPPAPPAAAAAHQVAAPGCGARNPKVGFRHNAFRKF